MDLEGFAKRRILKGADEKQIVEELSSLVSEFKEWGEAKCREFSLGVLEEARTSMGFQELDDPFLKKIIDYPKAGVKMGEFGVGSRGEGDFYVHRKIAEIIGTTSAVVDPSQQDDAGVVEARGNYVVTAIDGMHSRLSDFPFLSGFHVARAALRDVYVMGAKPVALISDLHLADDGDVGKLFDFTAGAAAVSELTGVPIVSGSTLRIGGDMVFGDRLVAAVGAIGVSETRPTARKNARPGDAILVMEGSGGGTITTIGLYTGNFKIIKETLNVEFMETCGILMEKGYMEKVHTLTDVTNGGLRGDAREISETAGLKLTFYEKELRKTVNPRVLKILEELEIDPMGISTDSLMIILPQEYKEEVKKLISEVGKVYEAGYVESGEGAWILGEDVREFKPGFRESSYTRIKKIIGEQAPEEIIKMKESIENAKTGALHKKAEVIDYIKNNRRIFR